MTVTDDELHGKVTEAVTYFWQTRRKQAERQKQTGASDQGSRGAVTGGAQMDGFIKLITEIIESAGINIEHIYFKKYLELPDYFRPTKEWDLLVVKVGGPEESVMNMDFSRKLKKISKNYTIDRLTNSILLLEQAHRELMRTRNADLMMENAVLSLQGFSE